MDPFGQAIDALGLAVAEPVRRFHAVQSEARYQGEASVERGQGRLVRLLLGLGRFPPSSQAAPLSLQIRNDAGGAEWIRLFGGHETRSSLRYDPVRKLVLERLGPFTIGMALTAEAGRLHVAVRHLWVAGLPLPRILLPISDSVEYGDAAGRFCFDISARLWGLGRLIRYHGWVAVPVTEAETGRQAAPRDAPHDPAQTHLRD
jgi:hypothetical protein